MAVTLEQVDIFHQQRGNAEWEAIGDDNRPAALLKAFDYVEANYAPLIDGAEDTPRFLIAIATLALRITQNPQTGDAKPTVKKEAKEGVGFKKEVEYFEPASLDPYPGVTGLMAPLRAGVSAPSVTFGRLVR